MIYLYTLFYIFINFSIVFIKTSYSYEDLKNPDSYQNEICSYHGTFNSSATDPKNSCICDELYYTKKLKDEINGHKLQCSVKRKHALIALFFAVFIPIGIDRFYLGHYVEFAFILIFVFIVCGFSFFFLFQNEKEDEEFSNPNSQNKKDFNGLIKMILYGLHITAILSYIINIVLLVKKKTKDGNGEKLVNDISDLFNINS